MNFKQFIETQLDPWTEIKFAEQMAKQWISRCPQVSDLADFTVMCYTNQELKELGIPIGKWIGQYSRGSINSSRGATVLINIDRHPGRNEMADTLVHEMGHALWELLGQQGRKLWGDTEESFADDFMNFVRKQPWLMHNEQLFLKLIVAE
jgi:hypothetical protein